MPDDHHHGFLAMNVASPHRALGTACLALALHGTAAAQELFPASLDLQGPEPLGAALHGVGDFTGNGIGDLLAIYLDASPCQVVPSLGGGQFGVPVAVCPTMPIMKHVAVDDVNGDGLADFVLVQGNGQDAPIVLYLNEGDLRFRPVPVGSHGAPVSHLVLADVDGDGWKDVFVSSVGQGHPTTGSGVFVFVFDGNQYDPVPRIATTERAEKFRALDMTGDGRSDIVRRSPHPSDRRWRLSASLANGGFSTPRAVFPSSVDNAFDMQFGDLDGDANVDIVALRQGFAQNQLILEHVPGGTFIERAAVSGAFGTTPTGIWLRDVDGDGIGDLVYLTLNGPRYRLYLRRGLGGFTYEPAKPLLDRPSSALGDLTGDGALNAVTYGDGAFNGETVYSQRIGDPDGPYHNAVDRLYGNFPRGRGFIAVDVDGDGDRDIVGGGPAGLVQIRNVGGLEFWPPGELDPGAISTPVAAMDLNGDGRQDLLLDTFSPSRLVVRFYRGPSDFSPPVTLSSQPDVAQEVVPADFDGDGHLDFISQLRGAPGIQIFAHQNNGAGTVFARTLLAPVQRGVQAALYFDVNADGFTDVVTLRPDAASVILSDGAGAFSGPVDFQSSSVPADFGGTVDLDRDGDLDVLGRSNGGPWMWAENNSLGSFTPFQPLSVAGIDMATRIRSLDVDGDGLEDLVAFGAETTSNEDVVLLADGNGGFGSPQRIGASFYSTGSTGFLDLDGDGDLDAWSRNAYEVVVHGSESIPSAGSAAEVCAYGQPNSTGAFGTLRAYGSTSTDSGNLSLRAIRLPANQFGMFVGSATIGAPVLVAGSEGALCLTGAIGRYDEPSEVRSSGLGGTFAVPLDPSALQTANGPVAALAGQTWYFQAWHRDQLVGGGPTSNFTSAIELTFTP